MQKTHLYQTLVEVMSSVIEDRYVVYKCTNTTRPERRVKNLGVLAFILPNLYHLC